MRIAVNTRLLIRERLEGIGWFSYETLRRICHLHPEHEFIFLFDRPYDPAFVFEKNVTPVVVRPAARHPFLWFFWFELAVPRILKKYKADLFLSTDGYLSLRSDVPSLCVIHDINFFHRPKDLPFWSRLYYNFFFPKFARKAVRIGTVSEFSRKDIASAYGVPSSKIDVMYNGSNELYSPAVSTRRDQIRKRVTGGVPYFIFIGTLHPRKNLVNLLKAFDMFSAGSAREYRLIIVGARFFLNASLEKVYKSMKYSDRVIFKGRLGPWDLAETLCAAEALTFVPFYEGFGIPLIEAMNCDIPVIASNVTSLPEVAGDAALYADPSDVEGIARAMSRVVTEPGLRDSLVEKGRIRREMFSWNKTAEQLWKMIEKASGTGESGKN